MFKKKKANKSNYYFDSFPQLSHFSVICGEMILDFMKNFDPSKLEYIKTSVHQVEHQADDLKHQVTQKLFTEFMTPIDREDIFELLRLIDDVTDAIEEISLKLFLYDYQELPPHTVEFTELTLECMRKTEECLKKFPDYLEKDVISSYIREVVHLEEQSDTMYIEYVHTLYKNEKDALKIKKWETIYSLLEEVSDRCREVCRYVQNIAFKNI
ncbi:MAG: DUF47 family protein [Bacilli bacterium]|nr:DUF47 family protein [Bacilli bacterium]